MVDFNLKDKIALITGASRGIGRAIALTLAEHGAFCILNSRKMEELGEAVDEIRTKGGKAEALAANVGNLGEIENMFAALKEKFGRLDILINNAATNPYFGEMIGAEEWAWEKTLAVNLKGPFFIVQKAVPLMEAAGGGAIVNVSSIGGLQPAPFQGIYSITGISMNIVSRKSVVLSIMAVLLLLSCFVGATIYAKKIPPDQVKISTPVYRPELSCFDPRMGCYSYTVSWNGIPAGSVSLEINRSSSDFQIKADARTAKGIDLIYKLRYHTKAVVSADTLLPKRSEYVSKENSKKKRTVLTFLPDGRIHSVRTDHRGRVKTLDFESDNFTLDPYSAAFLALSLNWDVGDTRQFDTFNGKNRHLIELTAIDRTQIKVNGKVREAIAIQPKVTKLTDTESSDKLKGAIIYISADDSREILQIVSDLFIGSVHTTLVGFEPTPAP